MNFLRGLSMSVLAAGTLASCSSSLLKPDPVCGAAIRPSQVLVLDVSSYNQNQSQIAEAVRARTGSYRIMTKEPVWIPKRNSRANEDSPGKLADVQGIAADWGCNLLLLLDSRMGQTAMKTQSRNEARVWLVEAGMYNKY